MLFFFFVCETFDWVRRTPNEAQCVMFCPAISDLLLSAIKIRMVKKIYCNTESANIQNPIGLCFIPMLLILLLRFTCFVYFEAKFSSVNAKYVYKYIYKIYMYYLYPRWCKEDVFILPYILIEHPQHPLRFLSQKFSHSQYVPWIFYKWVLHIRIYFHLLLVFFCLFILSIG